MRIVLIGGTGFIGGRVLEQLAAKGHELFTVQRHISTALLGSIRQLACPQDRLPSIASQLRNFKPDVVIDFISSSARQARATLEVFDGHAERLIAISSQDVYRAFGIFHRTEEGPLEPVPVTEGSPRRTSRETYPPEVLARLSRLIGWVNEEYNNVEMEDAVTNAGGLRWTILRLPMVYGPGDYLHRLYPILKRIADGRRTIPIADTVAQWRCSRGYVEDVAAAIALSAIKPEAAGQVFNVAEQDHFSELEWTQLVGGAAGWKGSAVTVPFDSAPAHLKFPAHFAQHATSDSTHIRQLLGYRETVSRADALQRTIAWERAHPPDPQPQFDYAAEDNAVQC